MEAEKEVFLTSLPFNGKNVAKVPRNSKAYWRSLCVKSFLSKKEQSEGFKKGEEEGFASVIFYSILVAAILYYKSALDH